MQHQRLRHLFASAILELWKKETGSVTSVLIEGTVCVTVHGGRTTVVQLCDRFAGLVNSDCERPPLDVGIGGTLRHSDGHLYVAPATPKTPAKSRGRPAATAATTTTQTKDSNNNVRSASHDAAEMDDAALGASVDTDDDECSLVGDDDVDDGQSSMLVDDDEAAGTQNDAVSGQTMSGTGSFSPDSGEGGNRLDGNDSADDSAIHDMSMNRTNNSLPDESPVVMTQSPRRGAPKTPASNSGNDLLLSSPHDYTAQVRNVIRQRLLNAGSKQSSSSSFRGQTSATSSMNTAANDTRPQSSPYYRPVAESTPPSLWIKRETPSAAASEAMATAARRLASQYAAAAAGHIPMTLMSPPPAPLAMPVGLPIPGVPLNASLHNLLGMKTTGTPTGATVLMPGTVSPRIPPATPDSKRGNATIGSLGGVEPPSTGTSGDAGQTTSEQKIYRCDYCNKTFLFKSKYHEHLPVHTSLRPFQCHLCTRTYKYKYDLRVHLRTHLGIPTKSTVCPFCAARFATNKFLRQHMREAHSDQNVASTVPPTSVAATLSAGSAAEMPPPPSSENVEEEQERDDVSRTEAELVVDDCNNDAAAAASSPPTAAETVTAAEQNDSVEI